MKKKVLSMAIAAAMVISCSAAVTAEDKVPSVFVDNSEILFEDQTPVILGEGFTVVPARGVFEAMGATVEWKEETRQVDVTSEDGNTLVRLFIDDNTMKVYDLSGMFGALMTGQSFQAPETPITLDVAPQIINDRTMIPLRAISEAIDADVQWDGESYSINITTADMPTSTAGLPSYSLSADKLTVAEGETVDIYINVANLPANTYVSGVSAAINYDKENFEFVEAVLVNGENTVDSAVGASNPDFTADSLKTALVTVDAEAAAKTDGTIVKLTFKSLTGKEGSFSLAKSYHTQVGYSTTLLVETIPVDDEAAISTTYMGNDIVINTEAVVINSASAEVIPTEAPEETVAPEATIAPEATEIPEETEEPVETAEPTATPEA